MKKEEVIDWLMIMKANLNSFPPEVSGVRKIEALAEAIRLLKNERSIDKIDCEHTECRNCTNHKYCDYEISSSENPNKSIEEKCPCYDCEYFVIDGLSHCKIYEDAYGDSRCNDYRKANQGLNKVNQDLNKLENPTGSTNTISFKEMTDNLKITAEDIENAEDLEYSIEPLVHPKNDSGVREFEEIVVEYPPEDLCTYPEYKGKPYFSIKYKEGNDCFIGYGTYSPKVFSRFLRDYFMPSVTPQEPKIVPIAEIKFDEDKLKELVDKAVLTVSQSGVTEVLDKIRAEIENHCGLTKENHCRYCSYCNNLMGIREILEIIDKYKGERSDDE